MKYTSRYAPKHRSASLCRACLTVKWKTWRTQEKRRWISPLWALWSIKKVNNTLFCHRETKLIKSPRDNGSSVRRCRQHFQEVPQLRKRTRYARVHTVIMESTMKCKCSWYHARYTPEKKLRSRLRTSCHRIQTWWSMVGYRPLHLRCWHTPSTSSAISRTL